MHCSLHASFPTSVLTTKPNEGNTNFYALHDQQKIAKYEACLKLETGVVDVGVRGVSQVTISTMISSRYWHNTTAQIRAVELMC